MNHQRLPSVAYCSTVHVVSPVSFIISLFNDLSYNMIVMLLSITSPPFFIEIEESYPASFKSLTMQVSLFEVRELNSH